MDNKQITAAEAKRMAETSEIIKKRINKLIKAAAEEGMLRVDYDIQYTSTTLFETIKKDLVARGFGVSIVVLDEKADCRQLVITWNK